jgi:hypothetical protein
MVLAKSSLPAAIVSSTCRLTAGIYSLRPSSTTVAYTGRQTARQTGQWKESRMGIYRTQSPSPSVEGAPFIDRQTVSQTGQWKESRKGIYSTQSLSPGVEGHIGQQTG